MYTNPGPNFAWHVDGYDKLKPYGFPIHGCVEGFRRRVMWLTFCPSNNDPSHLASLFYDCVISNKGCPRVLRTDCGTENGTMTAMQCYYRGSGNDDQAGLNVACEQALVWVLCARCETRVAKPRERGARWAELGEERACSYYCKFFIPTPEAIKFHRKGEI